jgi:hypothetical protein
MSLAPPDVRSSSGFSASQPGAKRIGTFQPEGMLVRDPPFGLDQAAWLDREPVLSAADLSPNQTGRLEDGDVARNACKGDRERLSQVADACIAGSEGNQQGSPGGMRERAKGAI